MLGLRPKPKWGVHPHAPERGSPRGQKDTDYIYLKLHVNLPCPRKRSTAPFSNVRPVPVKFGETFKLSSEFKLPSDRTAHTNTLQFKRFREGVRGKPLYQRGSPGFFKVRFPVPHAITKGTVRRRFLCVLFDLSANQPSLEPLILIPGPIVEAMTQLLMY